MRSRAEQGTSGCERGWVGSAWWGADGWSARDGVDVTGYGYVWAMASAYGSGYIGVWGGSRLVTADAVIWMECGWVRREIGSDVGGLV